MNTLGRFRMKALRVDLIIHHGITDILGHAGELIYILGAVQEPSDLASLLQWDQVSENVIQFPSKLRS